MLEQLRTALGSDYRLERELGGGGMSRVFLAEEVDLGRKVVVKVLPPEMGAGVNAERFRREIQLAAQLQHPHIVPLLHAARDGDLVYYTMPLVEGESLRARVAREGQLPVSDVVRILRDVVDALAYAHARGVVHRDIKPDNVLLSHHHALVTDFGVAKAISEATGQSVLTSAGVALGTPAYMAPEQVTADPHADHRCDIYAVGAVGYEMLTGRPPFTGATPQHVLAAQVTQAPDAVTRHRTVVPPALEALIMRCIEKSPADRWQSAEDLLHQLEATTTPGGGLMLTQEATGRRGPRMPIPVRLSGRTLLAALVVALAAGALLWHPWRRPTESPAATTTPDVASVAVLPFENIGGNPADAYLSEGMTEEIIGQLAQVQGLKVISRTSTGALKGSGLTTRQIAETLGVRHVLEGSVRHAGNRIRVGVDLIDARNDAHVWASSYDRDLSDVFAVQAEIARQVSESLVTTVGARPVPRRASRTDQPEAYEAYLHGRYLLHRRTVDGLRGAAQEFDRAIGQDSSYAPAYAGLASVYMLWATYDYAGQDLHTAYGRAAAAASRGIALDSGLAEAYAARGYVATRAWAPSPEIAADFRQALKLRPSSADVHGWYAHFLSREHRYDDAVAEAERAIALDPLAPGRRVGIAEDALGARRYDIAAREAERASALEPGLMLPRALQGLALLLLGDASRCATIGMGPYAGVRAMCLYSLGRKRESGAIMDSLRGAVDANRAGDTVYSAVIAMRGIATYYAWTGNAGQALRWLERAYALSPEGEDFRVIDSGIYDPVRNDPRFRDGLERLHTQIYSRFRQETLKARRG